MQTSIFDFLYKKYKITKPIRLIEFFAGYGSQALALKYLGVPFEHYKISEWAIKSIQAYKDIHFTNVDKDYTKDMTKEDLIEYFKEHNISSNYNDPLNETKIKRLSEDKLRTIYNNMKITNNLGSIVNVKGKDLDIVDCDKYTYLLTYSFPCQDLSLAGKRAGMNDTSTRSGMLWEVERILDECKELGNMPKILLMENVPQVVGQDNLDNFIKWTNKLEILGYKNYWQNLIATDYGIPQTRNRTFMISILGDYNYTFPQPIPLKLKLKDLLEDEVDEKYFLSDAMIKYCWSDENQGKYNRKLARESCDRSIEKGIACTITTTAGQRPTDNFIKIKKELCNKLIKENKKPKVIGGFGKIGSTGQYHQQNRVYDNNVSISITTGFNPNYPDKNLRIRKLTPRECFRLMGVKDEDFNNVSKNQSDASLFHLAGDSIVVDVLMAIFGELI